jgi:ABC-2 type transport system ATP-binding protein
MGGSTGPAVEVRGLVKRYGERDVLRGIDLTVERGEVVALLGPNGAGKTTTVEILEGYRDATAGQVRVLGLDPALLPVELRSKVGVVLQECGFPEHLRVGELLSAWRAYYPDPRPVDELLEIVGLTDDERTMVRSLSGGQRRRLDFALALVGRPELIFLDEPTTGFDPEARRRCWTAIENLRALGTTVVMTTHYLDEAERLADRIAILDKGVISAAGTASQLARASSSPTRVSFAVPEAVGVGRVEWPACLAVQATSGTAHVETHAPGATVRALLEWASKHSLGDIDDLAVVPPSLEDVYLDLTSEAGALS